MYLFCNLLFSIISNSKHLLRTTYPSLLIIVHPFDRSLLKHLLHFELFLNVNLLRPYLSWRRKDGKELRNLQDRTESWYVILVYDWERKTRTLFSLDENETGQGL